MKSFRTPAVLGAVTAVLLTSGAAFAGTTPASSTQAMSGRAPVTATAPAKAAPKSGARSHNQARQHRGAQTTTPAKPKK